MRTFDYRHLPKTLLEGKVADAHVRLYENKGKLEALEQLHPEVLANMSKRAHIDSVDASARIEGFYVDNARVGELVEGASPNDEIEHQIVGYSQALKLIEQEAATLDLSTATILQLFEALYGHRDLGRKSRYRKKDYMYVQVDGRPQAMPVSPITAFETPLVLGGACDSLADSFDAESGNALQLAAVFTVDFLCIRPFDEGNGRISRLFADLMLAKAGVHVAHYLSVDRIIEQDAMAYYNALNACVEKWDVAQNDYAPFVLYWFEILNKAYQQLFDAVDLELRAGNSKSERVRLFVLQAKEPVGKRAILEAVGNVSEATVEAVLGQMVKDGELEKLGSARATKYRPL